MNKDSRLGHGSSSRGTRISIFFKALLPVESMSGSKQNVDTMGNVVKGPTRLVQNSKHVGNRRRKYCYGP